jgi:hypothetical protein
VLVLCVLSLLVGVLEAANVAAVYSILSEAFDTAGQESFVLSLIFDAVNIPAENRQCDRAKPTP